MVAISGGPKIAVSGRLKEPGSMVQLSGGPKVAVSGRLKQSSSMVSVSGGPKVTVLADWKHNFCKYWPTTNFWQTNDDLISNWQTRCLAAPTQDRRIKKPYQENFKYFCQFSL